jgi:glycosyltransferase involved in cell wall biosynthesis
MSGLHIVMLAPFGIRPKGTLSARMLPLARSLVQHGYSVSIVAPPVQNPQDAGRHDVYGGVSVIHTALPTLPGPAGVAQQVAALLRQALARRPDVLHLFKPKGYSGLAALLAQIVRPQIPLVVDTDDWEGWGGWNDLLPYPYAAKMLFAWQERDLLRRAAAVTVVSRTLEQQVLGFGVESNRVVYLPNGISRAQLEVLGSEASMAKEPAVAHQSSPLRTQNMLLYTRFWELDVRDVAATLAVIANRCPAARLMIVGRGERGEEQELLELGRRAGVARVIDYRGWAEPAEIPALLATADLALAPMNDTLINRARGLAKLLEMMAAGLPIVAARVGQAAEYIEDGRSGLLVQPGDPASLAQAALRLLGDAALRARLGRGARDRAAEHYTWERLALVAEAAYQRALR